MREYFPQEHHDDAFHASSSQPVLQLTVQDMKEQFTKREVEHADQARLLKHLLYDPSDAQMATAFRNGTFINNKMTAHDLANAQIIYGPSKEAYSGKSKRRPATVTDPNFTAGVRQKQTMYCDISFVLRMTFLDTYVKPMGHSITTYLRKGMTESSILTNLQHHVKVYLSMGCEIVSIYADLQFRTLGDSDILRNIRLESAGGKPVPEIEAMNRVRKERLRGRLSVLPYRPPTFLIPWLTISIADALNYLPRNGASVSPREMLTGQKLDLKQIVATCGDYCIGFPTGETTNRVDVPREEEFIALALSLNQQKSARGWSLVSRTIKTFSQVKRLPIPQRVIDILNARAASDNAPNPADLVHRNRFGPILDPEREAQQADALPPPPTFIRPQTVVDAQQAMIDASFQPQVSGGVQIVNADTRAALEAQDPPMEGPDIPIAADATAAYRPELPEAETAIPHDGPVATEHAAIPHDTEAPRDSEVIPHDDYGDFDHKGTQPEPEQPLTEEPEPSLTEEPQAQRRSSRAVNRPDYSRMHDPLNRFKQSANLAVHTLQKSVGLHRFDRLGISTSFVAEALKHEIGLRISMKEASKRYPEASDAAVRKELQQLYDLKTFSPVDPRSLTREEMRGAIRSFLFLKEKFLADGAFEKLKARMVGGGDRQDRNLYPADEISSPTATTSSIFMTAITAAKEGRIVVTIDVPGAYLHASLKPEAPKPLMIIEPHLAKILFSIDPDWSKHARRDGSMVVRMNKGLYGLIESAKLWNDHLTDTLKSVGFAPNPLDPCVLNTMVDGHQCTICIHVDDLFVSCKTQKGIDLVVNAIKGAYGSATLHNDSAVSYLGMMFNFGNPGEVVVTMGGFIQEWFEDLNVHGSATTPALPDLFTIDESSPRLAEKEAKFFHSQVAKALYAAKRGRPDILTAVAFLSTRPTKSTEQDLTKLQRLLKYVNGTKELSLTLSAADHDTVVSFIDTSFATHADMKSHAGSCITLGKGFFYSKSSKQSLTVKSSTEAELVGATDHYSMAVWSAEFLRQQGKTLGPAIIAQDNISTISLIKKGRAASEKTRHVDIRYFFLKDRVDQGAVTIQFVPSVDMVADYLTKPLQGELFKRLRSLLMGESISPIFQA
jgi:hypothetical protein